MSGRATAVTRMGREKILVLGMVSEVLQDHSGGATPVFEGSLQGLGRWSPDDKDDRLDLPRRSIVELGEKPMMARMYTFDGKVFPPSLIPERFQANCIIFEGEKVPRAAGVSLVFPRWVHWYTFFYGRDGQAVHRWLRYEKSFETETHRLRPVVG